MENRHKIKGRVVLNNLRPISQDEFATASRICQLIKGIQQSRATYVKEHHLNPNIALPGSIWAENAENTLYDNYHQVITPTYHVINNLRLYTYPFTGYRQRNYLDAKRTPIPDRWIYRYIDITRHLPEWVKASPPRAFGEVGWNVGGVTVNHDLCTYQERLNLLYEAGILDCLRQRSASNESVSIIEIGGGYGALAYYIKTIIPRASYYIVDLPEALLFSSLYLALAMPEHQQTIFDAKNKYQLLANDMGFKFIPNFMFEDALAADMRIDLAINTLSFPEMRQEQVRHYARNLKTVLGDSGVLFEHNFDRRVKNPSIYRDDYFACKECLADYFPFRETISPTWFSLRHGEADIWANKEIASLIDVLRHPSGKLSLEFYWKAKAQLRFFWHFKMRSLLLTPLKSLLGLGRYESIKNRWLSRYQSLKNHL